MLAGLIVDITLYMSRFIAEYVHPTPAWNEEDNKLLFASMNLLYFGKSQDRLTKFMYIVGLHGLSPFLGSPQLISISFVGIFSLLLYNVSTSPPFSPPHLFNLHAISPQSITPHLFPLHHFHFPKLLLSTQQFYLLTLSNSPCLPIRFTFYIAFKFPVFPNSYISLRSTNSIPFSPLRAAPSY